MPALGLFAAGTLILTAIVVVLARLSARHLDHEAGQLTYRGEYPLRSRELLANVILTQGLVVAILVGLILWTGVPLETLGLDTGDRIGPDIAIGIGFGLLLYLGNEASVHLFDRTGIAYSDALRSALAPHTPAGWAGLVGVVLPVIAIAEELLFRAALITGVAAGLTLSPWLLVIPSAIAFSLGHVAQGQGGVIVTGLLGIALGAVFVWTGSLLVVVVAHYVINLLEFVVHEGVNP